MALKPGNVAAYVSKTDWTFGFSYNLRSLERCPDGLKSLYINGHFLESLAPLSVYTHLEIIQILDARHISDLNPLTVSTRLMELYLMQSQVTDISALLSMPLLEILDLKKEDDASRNSSIKDLSPLAQCKRLGKLSIGDNQGIEDISPLAHCTQLELLNMEGLTNITKIKPLSSLTRLKELLINNVPVEDLSPLSALKDLEELCCQGIPPTTSLLPLARCGKLKTLECDNDAKDLDLFREKRPDIEIDAPTRTDEPEDDEPGSDDE